MILVRHSVSRKLDLERILKERTKRYIWDTNKGKYILDLTGQKDFYRLPKYPTKDEVRKYEKIKKRLAMDDEW